MPNIGRGRVRARLLKYCLYIPDVSSEAREAGDPVAVCCAHLQRVKLLGRVLVEATRIQLKMDAAIV